MVVDSRFLITISKPAPAMAVATTAAAGGRALSNQTHQSQRSRKQPNAPNPAKTPPCHRSHEAAADAVVLIAVLLACGFLALPYLQMFCRGLAGVSGATLSSARTELRRVPPLAYLFVGLSSLVLAVAILAMFRCGTGGRKCGNPNCRGLRKAAEFDIQIETGECTENSSCPAGGEGLLRGFFELKAECHRDLEADLKKLAPPNGRAVLIFRARCGCSVGRMVVSGPKKLRKLKK